MRRFFLFLLAPVVILGCVDDSSYDTHTHELAHPGGWAPPAEILALADTFNIENVQAGTWVGPSGCGGQFLEGTALLREWVLEYWPQVTSVGGYSCRAIANSNSMSVHGTGRAIDIMIPVDPAQPRDDSADNDLGDPLANWLLANAEEIGLQGIIWDNKSWYSSRPPGERLRTYTNTHKHHDHLHVEINPEGAAMQTPWFASPMGPPDLGPCGETIPAEGGAIDNEDDCFTAYGPAEFWRTEQEGHGGTLHWTNAWQADSPSNWARWNLDLEAAGRYRVEYHHVGTWAKYDSVRYEVRAAGQGEEVQLDLSAGEDGWQLIGEYDFEAGTDQWVSVYDNSPFEVPDDQHVIADAIRLVPPMSQPDLDDDELLEPPTREPGTPGDPNVNPGTGAPGNNDADGASPPGFVPGEDAPRVINGEGGCCSVTPADDLKATPLLLLALLFGTRRLRRSGQ